MPRRGRAQADGGVAPPAAPPGPGCRVRVEARSHGAGERSGPGRRRDARAGAEAWRAAGRARDAGVGAAPHPREAPPAGREGHGAGLRRPDERDVLRDVRPPRRAGIRGRRASGAGPERRRDRAGRAGPAARAPRAGRGARAAARPLDAAPRRPSRAATESCTWTTCSRPPRAPTSTSCAAAPARTGRRTSRRATEGPACRGQRRRRGIIHVGEIRRAAAGPARARVPADRDGPPRLRGGRPSPCRHGGDRDPAPGGLGHRRRGGDVLRPSRRRAVHVRAGRRGNPARVPSRAAGGRRLRGPDAGRGRSVARDGRGPEGRPPLDRRARARRRHPRSPRAPRQASPRDRHGAGDPPRGGGLPPHREERRVHREGAAPAVSLGGGGADVPRGWRAAARRNGAGPKGPRRHAPADRRGRRRGLLPRADRARHRPRDGRAGRLGDGGGPRHLSTDVGHAARRRLPWPRGLRPAPADERSSVRPDAPAPRGIRFQRHGAQLGRVPAPLHRGGQDRLGGPGRARRAAAGRPHRGAPLPRLRRDPADAHRPEAGRRLRRRAVERGASRRRDPARASG